MTGQDVIGAMTNAELQQAYCTSERTVFRRKRDWAHQIDELSNAITRMPGDLGRNLVQQMAGQLDLMCIDRRPIDADLDHDGDIDEQDDRLATSRLVQARARYETAKAEALGDGRIDSDESLRLLDYGRATHDAVRVVRAVTDALAERSGQGECLHHTPRRQAKR